MAKGDYAVPKEVRALRPEGVDCIVKKIAGHYYVYARTKIDDPARPGRTKWVSGGIIGKIEGSRYVPNEPNTDGDATPPHKERHTADDLRALPEDTRAELIDGELHYLASPSETHQAIVQALSARLKCHIDSRGAACKVCPAPFSVNLFAGDTTFVEPDVSVVCDLGKLSERGCEGAPDFVVEVVSASDHGRDYLTKLGLYHKAGVREYWISDPEHARVLAYRFGTKALMDVYAFSDVVPAETFPGFAVSFAEIIECL